MGKKLSQIFFFATSLFLIFLRLVPLSEKKLQCYVNISSLYKNLRILFTNELNNNPNLTTPSLSKQHPIKKSIIITIF